MISANELRIGNIVESTTHNLKNAVVEGITPTGLVLLKDVSTYDYLDKINPIALAPEILEQHGIFRQSEKTKMGWTIFSNWDLEINVDEAENPFKNIDLYYNVNMANNVWLGKYPNLKFHQLQNLYFALKGRELKQKS